MAGTWGGRLSKAAVATALTFLGLLAFSVPALADSVPKPDPPPKAHPPPPPPVSHPPAPQPAGAVVPVATPSVVGSSTADRDAVAARRAAAERRALRRATRAVRAMAAAAQGPAAAGERARANDVLVAENDSASSSLALPFLLVAFPALLLLGLALTPARAVPWSRVSRALEDRRDELGVMGAMGLVAMLAFFLLVAAVK